MGCKAEEVAGVEVRASSSQPPGLMESVHPPGGEEGPGDGVGVWEQRGVGVVFLGCSETPMKWCIQWRPQGGLSLHPKPLCYPHHTLPTDPSASAQALRLT